MAVQFAVYYFLCRPYYSLGNLRVKQPQACIYLRRRLLDLPKSAYKLARKAQITDREIEDGALRAGTVIRICGYFHLTHRIALDARFLCAAHFISPRSVGLTIYYIIVSPREMNDRCT